MSWSITLIGTPEGVNRELDAYGETLSGQSKDEFLEAKPHIQALIAGNVGPSINLSANGHATVTDGKKTYAQVSVSLASFYGKFCQ